MYESLSLEDFKNSLLTEENGGKIKFAVKIFRCLQYAEKHPDLIPKIGACWYSNGSCFASNSMILGDFLKIKPNTINTNYRWHGFQKIDQIPNNLSAKCPTISDIRNWKIRKSKSYAFNNMMTEDDARKIPCLAPSRHAETIQEVIGSIIAPSIIVQEKQKYESSVLKQPINQSLAFLEVDHYIMETTKFTLKKLKRSNEEIDIICNKATKEWKEMFGECVYGSADVVAQRVCAPYANNELYQQLLSNTMFLLGASFGYSQTLSQEDKFAFSNFLKFFLQYGSVDRAGSIIYELAMQENPTETPSQSGPRPTFQPWFKPSFNDQTANALLSTQPTNSWLVRPSSLPGCFVIQRKIENGNSTSIFASHISFNCIADDSHLFSIEFEGKGTVYASSFNSLLFDILELDIYECSNFHNSYRKASYGKADNIKGTEDKLFDFHLSPQEFTLGDNYHFEQEPFNIANGW